MESCPIPIEICELIIDFVGPESYWSYGKWKGCLTHCALTCRAWRTRAQRRLWEEPYCHGSTSIKIFIDAIRHVPDALMDHIHTLHLNFKFEPSRANDSYPALRLNELLLTNKISNLRELTLRSATGLGSPLTLLHPKILRMCPPLLTGVTVLRLSGCSFSSPRSMLDLIWACRNLSTLALNNVWRFTDKTPTSWRFPLYCAPLFNVNQGSVFGDRITSISLEMTVEQMHRLTKFLPGVFPVLTTVHISIASSSGNPEFSVLHMLVSRVVAPTTVKTIHIWSRLSHDPAPVRCEYCKTMVGHGRVQGEGEETHIRERFWALKELHFDVHEKSCAAHIDATLPNMRNVLRFTYYRAPDVVPRTDGVILPADSDDEVHD
ncbi:hypothetical protein BC628DRAFT_1422749 [Trametes gibbosa]|nr:hypothetical protein BC628DRAFT_1422749 [Trametes gibbosa]